MAENCSPLQSQPDAKGEFFRLVAEQGHYGGRTFPTPTRQGLYVCTPGGTTLGALNTRDAGPLLEMLQTALERWDQLAVHATSEAPGEYDRFRADRYPHGGLVLRAIARDLPREVDTRIDDWRKIAWNLDYAWFTREEAASLVPDPALPGATAEASPELVRRLGRFHLRDFVRGEPAPWPADALHDASLSSVVTGVSGDTVTVSLHGRIRLEAEFRWVRQGDGQSHASPCSFDATLSGEAEWDRMTGRFVRFDLAASGPRAGTQQYNNRPDDLGPAPMAVVFELAGDSPRDRTPPHTVLHAQYFGEPA